MTVKIVAAAHTARDAFLIRCAQRLKSPAFAAELRQIPVILSHEEAARFL